MVRWPALAVPCGLLLLAGCVVPARPAPAPTAALDAQAAPIVDLPGFMTRYERFVTTFPDRAGNVATHVAARDDIARQMSDANLTVWRQDFATNGLAQQNVVGIEWGTHRDEWVVVAAHYDSYSNDCVVASQANQPLACAGRKATQGAYDNGSGTTLVLETARLLANRTPTYTLAFALLDGEERGLEGAQAFVKAATEGTPWGPVSLRAAVVSDMFGLTWPGIRAPVHFYGNSPGEKSLVKDIAAELQVPDQMLTFDGLPGSGDDAIFAGQQIPTGAFDSDFSSMGTPSSLPPLANPSGGPTPGVYPFWHQVDTWDTMTAMAGSRQALAAGFGTALEMEWRLAWGLGQGHEV